MMLWNHYVFRRGDAVHDLWDRLFEKRPIKLLYISGRGFDIRTCKVMDEFMQNIKLASNNIQKANLRLINFTGYHLSDELKQRTELNAAHLRKSFEEIGSTEDVMIGKFSVGEEDISATAALKYGLTSVLQGLDQYTDVVLDVSSLPRVVYLAVMIGVLDKLVPNKGAPNALHAASINFQVLVAEDVVLDSKIHSEEPSNELVLIPGFSSALHAESVQHWPLVWFPVLGENRLSQLEKVMELASIPENAEICPVLPHPSRNPRRADQLLVEYMRPLFDVRQTPTSSILYVHESHPFEAYRQLLRSMRRYLQSLKIMGGCRLVITPLASKLITIGVGLACFEMRTATMSDDGYGVAIPYAEPTRYSVSSEALAASKSEISLLLLTGDAYKH